MLNGFVLDELPGPLVVAAARQTRAAGGSVFFDPGAGSRCLFFDPGAGSRGLYMCTCIRCSTSCKWHSPSAAAVTCYVSASAPVMLRHCRCALHTPRARSHT